MTVFNTTSQYNAILYMVSLICYWLPSLLLLLYYLLPQPPSRETPKVSLDSYRVRNIRRIYKQILFYTANNNRSFRRVTFRAQPRSLSALSATTSTGSKERVMDFFGSEKLGGLYHIITILLFYILSIFFVGIYYQDTIIKYDYLCLVERKLYLSIFKTKWFP